MGNDYEKWQAAEVEARIRALIEDWQIARDREITLAGSDTGQQ